jgi:hypothetical protein
MVNNINKAMDRKNFQATNKDFLVFSLFFDQDKTRPKSAAVQITALKINPSPQLDSQDGHPGVGLQRSGFYFFGDENPRMFFYLLFLSVHNDFPRSRQNEKNNIAVHFAGRDPLSGLETHDLSLDLVRIIKDGLRMTFLRKLNHWGDFEYLHVLSLSFIRLNENYYIPTSLKKPAAESPTEGPFSFTAFR